MTGLNLRFISIKKRLYLLTLCITVLMLIPLGLLALDYKQDLLEAKQIKTRHLVETANSLTAHFHQLQVNGVLSEKQAQEQAAQALSKLRYEQNDYFWVNDTQPKMVMHPMKPQLNGKDLSNVKDPTGKKLFVEFVQVTNKSQQGFVYYMWPKPGSDVDVEKLSYVKLFKPWGWIIGSGVYIDDIEALFWQRVQSSSTLIAISLLFMLLVSRTLSKSIITPCEQLDTALNDIAEGEGDLTQQLAHKGNDELSHIAKAFNLFTSKIRTIVGQMLPVSQCITSTATQLNQLAAQTSRQAQQQHESVDTVASAMRQLHASNQEVATSATSAAEAAQLATSRGQDGALIMDEAAIQMNALSELLKQTEQSTIQLAADSAAVSTVLEVIRGVAEQTNLLALNAAIEAARAGEQGRGFAVVADEVRTLATRTQSSTDEIEQIINNLQQRADSVTKAMEKTQSQSVSTQQQAEEAKLALAAIDHQVSIILELNQHIAQSSQQQSTAAEEISHNLTNIAQNSDQSASQATEVAQASQELLSNGEQLQQTINQFKV